MKPLLTTLTAALALALAGCGVGTAPHSSGATLSVTDGFGARTLASGRLSKVGQIGSDLDLIRRFVPVTTTARGRIVTAAGHTAGPGQTWSFFVNGINPVTNPRRTPLNPGDEVWLDRRPTSAASLVAAVVGSFPEPFTTGSGGREYPTVEDCAPDQATACAIVSRALSRAGVKVASQALGGGSGQDSLSIVVGTFAQLRGVIAAELLAAGPGKSGVYGQFVGPQGQVLEIDGPYGNVTGTLRGSVGLIAAAEQQSLNAPTWLVTGTNSAGVQAAARALTASDLHNHYAVAVVGTRIIPLPFTKKP